MMTPRERVLTAMRREVPDQVPKAFNISPTLVKHYGIEVRTVFCNPVKENPCFAGGRYHRIVKAADYYSEWGV